MMDVLLFPPHASFSTLVNSHDLLCTTKQGVTPYT